MRGRRGVCICTWRKFRGRCLSGRRRHTPTTEGGGSGVVVQLKRNFHCFKKDFYGGFIPDSSVPCGGGDGGGDRLHTSMSMQHFNAEHFIMVGQAPPYDRSANRKTVVVNRPKKSGGITIAIHRKPHTVLRCLVVQPRTVFDNAPCLKLSVDGYICERIFP